MNHMLAMTCVTFKVFGINLSKIDFITPFTIRYHFNYNSLTDYHYDQ